MLESADIRYLHSLLFESNQCMRHLSDFDCKNQKLNPHTPAMMVNFGVDKTVFMNFMDEILFPETP